ncbi:MAG: hypothetical protein V4662_17660 [Verrucomicrobiota bacterium]
MPNARTVSFVGTAQERKGRHEQVRSERRQSMLQSMTPAQRMGALKQEQAFKQKQEAQQKSAADSKIRNTVAKSGTREEREQFREDKQRVRRDDMLAKMTPEQREAALKQESSFKEGAAKKAEAEKAKEKAAADDKTRRTVGKVGDKQERERFREDKQRVRRDDMLAKMTPKQREAALKQEAAAKKQEELRKQREADDRIRRTVAMVGSKEEREEFREDKQRVRRDDMLAKMTPPEREAALKREATAKAHQEAAEQLAADQKAARTVAIVGSKQERDAFHPRPRTTPTVFHTPGLAMSKFQLTLALSGFEQEAAA